VQKERSEILMSFVDKKTNKVDICRVLQKLEQLQQQFNERDIDRVVDLVLNDVFDNDLTKMEQPPYGPQITNPRWFGLAMLD
jgi:hypothetical protein